MTYRILLLGLILLSPAVPACAGAEKRTMEAAAPASGGGWGGAGGAGGRAVTALEGRLLVKRASLELEVDDPAALPAQADRIARDAGGYVESASASEGRRAWARLRIPAERLDLALAAIEKLGDVTRRDVSADDVTAEALDADARLQNLKSGRDRLRAHLERSTGVADVIAVEKELAWYQGEIDSLEARLKHLRSSAALSEVTLSAERPRILGPVGYVGFGLWWVVGKLFVIR